MMDPNRLKESLCLSSVLVYGACRNSCTTTFQYDNISTEWLVTIRLLISGVILLIISSFGTRKNIQHMETKI